MTDSTSPFRVIVVGGGLVGLSAAHILTQANIDFVILEQHDTVVPELGSLLAIFPPTIRIFDQLGINAYMDPIYTDQKRYCGFCSEDGVIIRQDEDFLQMLKKDLGYGMRLFHRSDLAKALYESLPQSAKARILLSKKVSSIDVDPSSGVTVHCEDGTSESGSLIIGADGVRSRVRSLMHRLRASSSSSPQDTDETDDGKQKDKKEEEEEEEKPPYVSTYRNLLLDLKLPPGLPTASNFEGSGHGVGSHLIIGNTRAWVNLYETLPSPTTAHARYTPGDAEAAVARWKHLHLAPGGEWTLERLYELRNGPPGLIDLEEGVLETERWSLGGRVVLVGDAVRKYCPNSGWGYNAGLSDVVVLTNLLRRLLVGHDDAPPSDKELEGQVLVPYREERAGVTKELHEVSKRVIRSMAWVDWLNMVLKKWVLRWVHLGKIQYWLQTRALFAGGQVLEWLEERHLPETAFRYKYYPVTVGTRE